MKRHRRLKKQALSSSSTRRRFRNLSFYERLEERSLLSGSGFQLRFDDGTNSLTVQDNGANDSDPSPGSIEYVGSVGNFDVSGTVVLSKPLLGDSTSSQLDGNVGVNYSSTSGGTLTVTWADTDFDAPPVGSANTTLSSTIGGTISGGVGSSFTFQSWANANNASPLDTDPTTIPAGSTSPGALGPYTYDGSLASGSLSGSASTPFTRGTGDFSMFGQAVVSVVGTGGSGNVDCFTEVQGTPMATPTIATSQQPASATVGSSIADQATVSGGNDPTGTVTFNLYDNPSGTGTPLFTDANEPLVNGIATSAGYTATATGTDYWVATYNGDSNNSPVTSEASSEPVTITTATPAVSTSQQPATAVVGTVIADQATVSGGYNPTGTVTFNLYNNPNGTGAPLFTDTKALVNGVATSAGYTATATGTDYWVATYNGDSNNSTVTSSATAEPVSITPATPAINTSQQPASAVVGSSIADKATVSGGYNPTGTVTFNLYSSATTQNASTLLFTDTEALVSGVATSAGYTATATGTDYWVATYNGDSNNSSVTSGTTLEPATITAATPAISTTQQPATAVVGTLIADQATVTGYNPTGTVTFNLYNNPNGTGTPLFTDTESLVNGVATSAGYTATATGTDYWVATYNGDSNNSPVISGAALEPVTVTMASPTISTTPSGTQGSGGMTIGGTKYLDVTGNGFSSDDHTPLAGVTIKLYQGGNGPGTSGDTLVASTTTASDGTYSFSVATAGTYYVQEKVPSGYIQTGGGPNGSAGNTYYTVNVAAGTNNTGYDFDDFFIPTCQPTCVTYTITHNGCAQTYSSLAGNTHPGDTVKVNFTVPSGMNDTLTLVSYYAQSPGWSDSNAYQQLIYQRATGTFSPGSHSLTVQIPSTDYQIDFVCGLAIDQLEPNQNNNAYGPDSANILYHAQQRYIDSDSGGNTPGTKNTGSPIIPSPSASPSGGGGVLNDSATLTGGYSPGGTITFYLLGPDPDATTPLSDAVYSDTVPVSGNGTYTTSDGGNPGGYTATAGGTYQWVVVYSGDGNNNTVTSPFGSEPWTVSGGPASPTIDTTPSGTSGGGGMTISGTKYFDVSGNGFSTDDTPLANVTINLYQGGSGPGASGDTLVASTATAADGTYRFNVPAAGTYYVQEAVPSGYVQTGGGPNGSAGNTFYTVSVATNTNNAGYNFDDFLIPDCESTCVGYVVKTSSGCSTWVSTLAGNTAPGDTVTAYFTVPSGTTDTMTLVSYYAQTSSWSDSKAYQQLIYQQKGGTFGPGQHSLTVQIPCTDYQIDFVCGLAISQLKPNQNGNAYGPDSANITYHAQQRYIDSDSGGWTAGKANTASPIIPSPTSSSSGGVAVLSDSATLSDGSNPGGTITFYLMAPGATASTPLSDAVYSDTVPVSGNGTYTTSQGNHPGGYTATTAGTYQWVVVYSGDANNNGATSPFGSEPAVVNGPPAKITGTKFNDVTGNGFSCEDCGLGGVKIYLYNNLANLGSTTAGSYVAVTTTAANGTYSFPGLPAGTYYVQEAVPGGYVQTGGGPNGSAGATYYTINAVAGQSYSGNDFDDFKVPTCTPTCVTYTVYNNYCRSTTVSDLRGNTDQGDVVTVTFTVPNGMSDQLSLVSYIAPGSSFNANTAYQQQIYDVASGTFGPGTHTLTVCLPNCYYQVDFVCGLPIDELGGGPGYGPAGSNIFYSAESRLISADNGGSNACSTSKGCSYGDFTNTSFWSSRNGQTLISLCDGSSYSTQLAQWLATTFPNLYGPGSSCCLVNSNGNYFTNSQVSWAYNNCASADREAFCTALSIYCTSTNLAGWSATNYANRLGLNVSAAGCGGDNYNVGSSGGAFGCGNNTTWSVLQLMGKLNQSTSCGSHVSSGGSSICHGINNPSYWGRWNATVGDGSAAYSPEQVREAYGVNGLALDGTGQTIAIVDAYDNPNIFASLDAFDQQFGASGGASLYDQYGSAMSFLTVIGQDGTTENLPSGDISGNWETEEALDVEWIHAMAPGAQIILVEANSQSLADLMSAVATAANQPNVSVVSMSWGFTEGQSALAADEAQYDSYLTTPAGHQGVTFVASTGDYGAANPEYPAFSPNVVAVGGTSLYLNADNSYNNETGWGYYSDSMGQAIGGGGGVSLYELEPAFQQGAQSTGHRTTPDVSMIADPATGVWVADTYNLDPASPFEIVGGTSLSAPSWAALIALANQARVAAGGATLGSNSPTETQQALYTLPTSDFNAVTTGNNGYSAGPGYNLVGGLGTPIANLLVPDLAAYAGSTAVPAGRIALTSAEATLSSETFGATNALTHVANAFTVTNVEVVGTAAGERFLSFTQASPPTSAAPALANDVFMGDDATQALVVSTDSPAGMPAVFSSGSVMLPSNDHTGSAAPSSTAMPVARSTERSLLGRSKLDNDALDTLFATGADDAFEFTLSSSGVRKNAGDTPLPGRDFSRSGEMTAVAGRFATRVMPVATPSSSAVANSSEDAAEAVAGIVSDHTDQAVEWVDAVAQKSAETVARAYESVVDALFGLLG